MAFRLHRDRHPRGHLERRAFDFAIGLVLVLSVDWFIGMARAAGDLIGNCVATAVIAAWEGDLDYAKAARVLDGDELVGT